MDNKNNNRKGPGGNRQGWGIIMFTTLLAVFVVMGLYSLMQDKNPEEISYDKFIEMVDKGEVDTVALDATKIYITLTDEARKKELGKDEENGALATNNLISQMEELVSQQEDGEEEDVEKMPDYFAGRVDDETLPQRLLDAKVKFSQEIPDTASSLIFELLVTLVFPLLMFGILINFVMRRMSKGSGMMGIGKSNAKVYVEKETGVTFQDVAGQDEAKESLQEVVDFLHNPGKYTGIGAKLRKERCLWDLREPERHFLQKRWQEKRKCRSSHCRVPHLWRCMSVSERPVCVTCSNRHSRWRRVSYLSMRSMRSEKAVIPQWAAAMMNANRH